MRCAECEAWGFDECPPDHVGFPRQDVLYLSGHVRPGWPVMLTPDIGQIPPAGMPWAADNGRFARPGAYTHARYFDWLMRMARFRELCLFAVAPDVYGSHADTLAIARPVLSTIRELGYRSAFVAQPGATVATIPWEDLDVLFLGGPWRGTDPQRQLAAAAIARGKWVHVGRVNSLKMLTWARDVGARSADGTYLAFAPDLNADRARGWLEQLDARPSLGL